MPALSTVAAATLAATLTISPAIAPPPSEDGTGNRSSTCTQTNTAGTTATTGQLSPQQLDQATEIIREARELLTLVTTAEGNDPRASSVAATLRAAGFTPAVQTGWRQLAVDTSDALLTTEDPEMQRVARILARNGHGPTAADVQRPAPSLGRAPTRTAPAPGSPFRAHPGDEAGPQMMTAEAPEQSARPSALRTALGSGAGGRAMLHAADSTNHCTSSPEDAAAQLDKLVEALELLTGADRDAQALLDQLADLNDDGRPRGEEARPPSTGSSDEPSTGSSDEPSTGSSD
ncbi:hypothetical protein, partial [Pseudonocardia kongjuensis]|uniref:hypothetical protein n=1 Tax=Pseudonocardia kongjuensis TaxID=102227 RepID=UPI0031DAF027